MASADNCQSGALVYFSQKANDHYRENEDAEVLLENEINPTIALFTIAEQRALDIQQRANGGEIPLGIYLASGCQLVDNDSRELFRLDLERFGQQPDSSLACRKRK
jgi:hypothetical protein